ncbi:box H/ACA snoRNP assembly protein Shq1 [Schizosaccharomyces cryophilus OY26]|uniref:Box H/ACA snoRNP assembly protein Shq1 n=1 Tax=Schizosaccharomyces cryophilus (strain OY26 / ATCC MYA-4695 / CBS 11777 / NBRC 106824 / NRRL Y48691) TaxID=653667 RepID=S9X654_SCHCR|nr:box H/ACA snoRNP assembly protein Shq1 [Schizosaccharomyces cryophilus OY26]EPY49266.1 box H/ACA snoRNP assembly protein Shq1 [Schizosaccharomyces cryophilus OY26]
MITPKFDLQQDADFLYLSIHAPHIKAQNAEIEAMGSEIHFCIAPYFLKLELPGNVLDDERSHASYDIGKGMIHIKFAKETPGEEFPNLDLLTTLLVNKEKSKTPKKALIEEVGDVPAAASTEGEVQADDIDPEIDWRNIRFDDPNFDWGLLQRMEDKKMKYTSTSNYGFNDQHTGLLKYLEGNEINVLPEPELTDPVQRSQIRKQTEDEKFDPEYYLADFYDHEMIDELIHYTPDYVELSKRAKSGEPIPFEFTENEQQGLLSLPKKSYIIENPKRIYLNLVALIFAYAYDHRTTLGDPSSESVWNIGIMAPNIACLDTNFSSIQEVACACFRRSLAYPLYRNWNLAETCWKDTYAILSLGKRWILRVLLRMKSLFEHHDVYYIYNTMIINDYAYWIQTANDNVLEALTYQVMEYMPKKSDVGWQLEELEAESIQQMEEDNDGED